MLELAALCAFYRMPLSEARALTVREFEAFVRQMVRARDHDN